MPNFLKLTNSPGGSAVCVNLDNLTYFTPAQSGTYLFFNTLEGESGLASLHVAETFDEILTTILNNHTPPAEGS